MVIVSDEEEADTEPSKPREKKSFDSNSDIRNVGTFYDRIEGQPA
jgi:hypothetical protein